jgi:hypothetical protein
LGLADVQVVDVTGRTEGRRSPVALKTGLDQVLLPGLVADLARARNGVEGPDESARPDVEAADITRRQAAGDRRVEDRRPTTITSRTMTGGEVLP